MKWIDYLHQTLLMNGPIDDVSIGFGGRKFPVSPIIKASLHITNKINGNLVIVFPEKEILSVQYLLAYQIDNFINGSINSEYDLSGFVEGQKLRFEDCVVIFKCITKNGDGKDTITIQFKDNAEQTFPISLAPYFQKVETKRLSTLSKFVNTYNKKKKELNIITKTKKSIIQELIDNKTHLNSTVVFVSEIMHTRSRLNSFSINAERLDNVLYMAQISTDGELINMCSGQMYGNPAIAISADLYSVIQAIEKGLTVHKIVIEINNQNNIDSQLDAFDCLTTKGVSIVCVTDSMNSFYSQPLLDRGFYEWRWDGTSLSEELIIGEKNTSLKSAIKNCLHKNIGYYNIDDGYITEAATILLRYKRVIDDYPVVINEIYDRLLNLVFLSLRTIIPLSSQKDSIIYELNELKNKVDNEKRFISVEIYNDLLLVVELLLNGFENKLYKKIEEIQNIIRNNKSNSICIIIPNNQSKEEVMNYWIQWCQLEENLSQLYVLYPKEYQQNIYINPNITIIPCWLNSETMRNILYSNHSQNIKIILYSIESKWKNIQAKSIDNILQINGNSLILQSFFNDETTTIEIETYNNNIEETNKVISSSDEYSIDDIELFITHNKYKRYISTDKPDKPSVSAIPISFVGGMFGFFRTDHKIITATNIIQNTSDSVELKNANCIQVGDYIVIRESEKDIIRDLADLILISEGKEKYRAISHIWKDYLDEALKTNSIDYIYNRLLDSGCKRGKQTIMNWLTTDDMITPQSVEDLINIATALNNDVLLLKVDSIFAAGTVVKSTHVKAGKQLSNKLKQNLASKLSNQNEINQSEIWDPIKIQIREIGTIIILKVINIGTQLNIEYTNTNRLLTE